MAEIRALVDEYGLTSTASGWIRAAGATTTIDPASEQVIATAPDASVAQVEQAIAAARHAFDSGPWPTADACRAGALPAATQRRTACPW